MLCIQEGEISPLPLHIAASDISQGQNRCCVFKKVQYRLSFWHIVIRTKLVLCIQKGAISPMSLQMCIQKGAISPKSLHITTSDVSHGHTLSWCCAFKKVQYRPISISQKQNWCCVFKKVQYRLSLCILLHPIYHKDKTGVVY